MLFYFCICNIHIYSYIIVYYSNIYIDISVTLPYTLDDNTMIIIYDRSNNYMITLSRSIYL